MERIRPLTPRDPESIRGYRLTGRLGEGGQGVVYLGETETGERVAVKLLHNHVDAKIRSGFLREVTTARKVASFCTARIMDSGEDCGLAYMITEYVEGPSLQDAVEEHGPRSGAELYRLAVGTATALTAIHEAGIVHRDFKPGNVLLGQDGPRVIDFGIARSLDTAASVASRVLGTPSYMAPEQLAGDPPDPAADVFAWGATIVYAATGRPPYGKDTIPAVMNRIMTGEPDLGGTTGPLRGLLAQCLAKEVRHRPPAREILFRLLERDGSETQSDEPEVLEQGRAAAAASDEQLANARTERWARTSVLPAYAYAQPLRRSTGWASWSGRRATLVAGAAALMLVAGGASAVSRRVIGQERKGTFTGASGRVRGAALPAPTPSGTSATPSTTEPTASSVAALIERAIAANRTASFTTKGTVDQGEDAFEAVGRFEYTAGASTSYDVTVQNPNLSDTGYDGMAQRIVLIGNTAYIRDAGYRVYSAAPDAYIEDVHVGMAMDVRWFTSPYDIDALLKTAGSLKRSHDNGSQTFQGSISAGELAADGPVAPFYKSVPASTEARFTLTVSRDWLPRRLDVDFYLQTEGAILHSAYWATYNNWGQSGTVTAP